jgi:hypothetical protein
MHDESFLLLPIITKYIDVQDFQLWFINTMLIKLIINRGI